jgi:hypothetical protein
MMLLLPQMYGPLPEPHRTILMASVIVAAGILAFSAWLFWPRGKR